MANRAEQFRQIEQGKGVAKRSRRAIHFDMGGGVKRAYLTIDPMHYGANADQEIDATWQPQGGGVWQWQMMTSSYNVHAKSQLISGQILQWVQPDTGQSVTLQPMGLNWVNNVNDAIQQISMPQAVTCTADDCILYWQHGYGTGRHFRYTVHPNRLVKHLIIDAAANLPAATVSNPYLELSFIFEPSAGVTVYVDGQAWDGKTKKNSIKRIEFRDASNNLLWYFNEPTATDAAGNVKAGIFKVRKSGNSQYCTVRFDKAWIDTATYPIEIDPTFTDGYGGDTNTAYDTYVRENSADTDYGTSTSIRLRVASTADHHGLLKFDISSIGAGATVNSATLSLFNSTTNASSYTFAAYNMLSANNGWLESATWNYADGAGASDRWAGDTGNDGGQDAGCSVGGTDHTAGAMGTWTYVGGTSAGIEHQVSLDTTTVANWITAHYGLVLKETGSTISFDWHSSDHATTGYRPKLVVDYTAATGQPYAIRGGLIPGMNRVKPVRIGI